VIWTKRKKSGDSLRETQTKATLDLCRKYENDLVQVSSHGTDCEVCKEFEGKVYSISGTHPLYPKLERKPPFCPGCRHSILPTSEEEIEVRKRERAEEETKET